MDRRSWPWKKKSSDKSGNTDALHGSNQAEQDEKDRKFVQISPEIYAYLTESEEQAKVLHNKVKVLNEQISAAQFEITAKDGLVKQHAKVSEEAVSGWEKAESEASALKLQLETVTLSKLAAEERAAHLDGALKECVKQVRTVKEESEQKLHNVVFTKTKQWEMMKAELEAKLADLEKELIRAGAENDALSRSLEERANLLLKVGNEKDQAESQIELLKRTIQSGEKEINSLKYELHVVSKELQIRNEEKNMSVRSADVATKQHLEAVKKLSKLEAECQRLRGLVRKKLPGPGALAQMKLEVDSWGRDHADSRLRRSPSRSSTIHHSMSSSADYALDNLQHMQKDNEFLTARLLSMEDEAKMLKDALSKRNIELQASRNMCARTAGKLHSVEVHMLNANQYICPTNSNIDAHFDGTLSKNESNPPSLTSMSEDGVDDSASCAESWANALASELSHFKKQKGGKGSLTENSNQMGLMDDFLEMEKLACLSSEAKGCGNIVVKKKVDRAEVTLSPLTKRNGDKDSCPALQLPGTLSSSEHLLESSPLSKLHSRISYLLRYESPKNNVGKILDGIRDILRNIEEEAASVDADRIQHEHMVIVTDDGYLAKQSKKLGAMDDCIRNAISTLHAFVKSLRRRASQLQEINSYRNAISQKIEQFSILAHKVMSNESDLREFVIALSDILSELSENGEIKITLLGECVNVAQSNNLDKVTSLENKVHHEPIKDRLSGVCSLMPHSSSDPDFEGPNEAFGIKTAVQLCPAEEYEQLRSEKRNLEMELAKCNEKFEVSMLKFSQMEKTMEELTLKMVACENSNSLAETRLKCMAESYKSLEAHKVKLENEIKVLQKKIDTLTGELAEERQNHEEDLARYKDLEVKMDRYENDRNSIGVDKDTDTKLKKEKEIAAAAEKLAECQETILLLGRQLQTMRPPSPAEPLGAVLNKQRVGEFSDDHTGPIQGMHSNKPSGQFDVDYTFSSAPGTGNVSPLNGCKAQESPSRVDGSPYFTSLNSSKRPKHRSRSSSMSFSNQLPEKKGRGFSRLFSKGKSEY